MTKIPQDFNESISKTLKPLQTLWEWQLEGKCRNADATLFFSESGEKGKDKRRKETLAKRVCSKCPVVQKCLAHALDIPNTHGIWGGLTEKERKRVQHQQILAN